MVSIIVPIFGVEKYIERCARSILCQSYRNIEVIFVNDCTHDRSIEILKGVLKEFKEIPTKILEHNKNRGLAAARNTGVYYANGDYILHVDSDDWIEPTMVEELVIKAIQDNSDITICGYISIFNNKRKINLTKIYEHRLDLIISDI